MAQKTLDKVQVKNKCIFEPESLPLPGDELAISMTIHAECSWMNKKAKDKFEETKFFSFS